MRFRKAKQSPQCHTASNSLDLNPEYLATSPHYPEHSTISLL